MTNTASIDGRSCGVAANGRFAVKNRLESLAVIGLKNTWAWSYTLQNRVARTSVAPMRTPTGCCDSSCRRAPTSGTSVPTKYGGSNNCLTIVPEKRFSTERPARCLPTASKPCAAIEIWRRLSDRRSRCGTFVHILVRLCAGCLIS